MTENLSFLDKLISKSLQGIGQKHLNKKEAEETLKIIERRSMSGKTTTLSLVSAKMLDLIQKHHPAMTKKIVDTLIKIAKKEDPMGQRVATEALTVFVASGRITRTQANTIHDIASLQMIEREGSKRLDAGQEMKEDNLSRYLLRMIPPVLGSGFKSCNAASLNSNPSYILEKCENVMGITLAEEQDNATNISDEMQER